MQRTRKNLKKGGVAEQIEKKTNLTMRKFCEINKLSYDSFLVGYYSKKSKKALNKIGIEVV